MTSSRDFYEKYFVELEISPEEKLKQYWRVKLLKRATSWIEKTSRGLFVGIGKGAELEARRNGFTIGLDLPFTYLPTVKNSFNDVRVVQGDGTKLPFADNSFDYIVCSEVVEHVPEREKMISEFNRVLAPGGHLVLTTPNWISGYGLARKLAEILARRDVHADDQPLDKWITLWSLKKELAPYFETERSRGFWYFPPIGRGKLQILPGFFTVIWKILQPLEMLNSTILPWLGHCVMLYAKVKK